MKKILMMLLLLAVCAMLSGCASIQKAMHPGEVQVAGVWVKQSEVDKFDFGVDKNMIANSKGDSYCKKCDKYIEGKVRICTYCGQYL